MQTAAATAAILILIYSIAFSINQAVKLYGNAIK